MMNEKIHFITESTGWHSEEPLELLNIIVFVFVIIINSLHWNSILHPKKRYTSDIFLLQEDLPALCFYDVTEGIEQSDNGGSFYNEKEAEFIEYLIESLIDHDVDPERIGVISLYKSQMYRIVTLLGTNK